MFGSRKTSSLRSSSKVAKSFPSPMALISTMCWMWNHKLWRGRRLTLFLRGQQPDQILCILRTNPCSKRCLRYLCRTLSNLLFLTEKIICQLSRNWANQWLRRPKKPNNSLLSQLQRFNRNTLKKTITTIKIIKNLLKKQQWKDITRIEEKESSEKKKRKKQ